MRRPPAPTQAQIQKYSLPANLYQRKPPYHGGMNNTTAEPMSHPCAPPSALMQSPANINNKISGTTPNSPSFRRPLPLLPSHRSNIQRFVSVSSGQASLAKIRQILANFAKFCKKTANFSAIFNENFAIRERCKGVHCVDLGESFPTSIYLQIWLRYSRERAL